MQSGKHFAPCGGLGASPCSGAIKNGSEPAGGCDGRIQLFDGSRGGVSRIGKGRQTLFVALGVQKSENGLGQIHLATNLDLRGNLAPEPVGNI